MRVRRTRRRRRSERGSPKTPSRTTSRQKIRLLRTPTDLRVKLHHPHRPATWLRLPATATPPRSGPAREEVQSAQMAAAPLVPKTTNRLLKRTVELRVRPGPPLVPKQRQKSTTLRRKLPRRARKVAAMRRNNSGAQQVTPPREPALSTRPAVKPSGSRTRNSKRRSPCSLR